jgi:hypothetical protein
MSIGLPSANFEARTQERGIRAVHLIHYYGNNAPPGLGVALFSPALLGGTALV